MPRNGRALAFDGHGAVGEMANSLGPVLAIRDDDSGSPGNALAEYVHLGIVWIVQEDYAEPEVRLEYDYGMPGNTPASIASAA